MADRKISELTNITGANLADDDEFALVDTSADETKAITFGEFKTALDTATGFVRITGDTMTGNLSMGDNVKAIFGNGSDLQIYHDGSNSYVEDTAAGELILKSNGPSISFQKGDGTELFTVNTSGSSTLSYSGIAKLATTSTGVDITGTLVSDGLTVDGDVTFGTGSEEVFKFQGGSSNSIIEVRDNNRLRIKTGTEDSELNRLDIENNGDISFYEDTGTTPKFYWDASTERLGIGNASPATALDVTGTVTADGLTVDGNGAFSATNPTVDIKATNGNDASLILMETTGNDFGGNGANGFRSRYDGGDNALYIQSGAETTITNRVKVDRDTGDISFYEDTGTTPKFYWDASAESLGIGISPSNPFEVIGSVDTNVATFSTLGDGGGASNRGISIATDTYGGSIRTVGSGVSMGFDVNGSERMRIDSSGNVGIGTDAPSSHLHVKSTSDNIVATRVSTNSVDALFQSIESASLAQIGTVGSHAFTFFTANQEAMRIDSSGNVLIATTTQNFSRLNFPQNQYIGFQSGNATDGGLRFEDNGGNASAVIKFQGVGSNQRADILFYTGDTNGGENISERMRIDSSGNLLVGKTTTDASVDGIVLGVNDQVYATRNGGAPLWLNRKSNDGAIALFNKDGTTVGSIGNFSTNLYIGTSNNALIAFGTNRVYPANNDGSARDNAIDLGNTNARFDDIFATNGTIQTSDRNEKQDIAELSDAEQRVAVAAKGLMRKFRWRDAVAEKGDEARTHFGIIAQDLQAAFAAEGLDAGDYAMFISSTWTDEDTGEEKTRMGVRYSELLAFIIAAI